MHQIPCKHCIQRVEQGFRRWGSCEGASEDIPRCPNFAGFELAPTTANAEEAKNFRTVASVVMISAY